MTNLFRKLYWMLCYPFLVKLERIQKDVELNRVLIAQSLIKQNRRLQVNNLAEVQFQVFSQWGEDGIIQYLLSKVPIQNEVFVELGVEDYREANTRFLLVNNNWRGLIFDSNPNHIDHIRQLDLYWRHDLTAMAAFVTKDNINDLVQGAGKEGDIGLLSIDIDGNDYWVWEAIQVVQPRIVVVEYNSLFGSQHAVVVPYREDFDRSRAHLSHLYYGASLKALCLLGAEKGYSFLGSNSAGSNAFFVRQDVAEKIIPVKCEDGYVMSKIRESRNENGQLSYVSGNRRLALIENEIVYDIEDETFKQLKDIMV